MKDVNDSGFFDPNGPGRSGNLFGLPFTPENAELIVVPVPWEVTVSYRSGTAGGPEAIRNASFQVDLAHKDIPDAWKLGIAMLPIPEDILKESQKLRPLAANHIRALESGEESLRDETVLATINTACETLNKRVQDITQKLLAQGKMVALLGGDHSTPLGFIRALSQTFDRFGILQIDAHADLRKAYEEFTYSHASIMYNALKMPAVGRLVQVGIRDYCDEELLFMSRGMGRIVTHFDRDLKDRLYEGTPWKTLCTQILKDLPEHVYISFDIDGLDPKLCPHTGTPVPGGLELDQALYLIRELVASGRKIIGFDLSEVAPGHDDWDANVGSRVLYQLCNLMAVSQGKLKTTAV